MQVLIVITLIIWFLCWISRPKDKPGVKLYFANIGSGKTTYLAKIAVTELNKMDKGKSIYKYIVSNAKIDGCRYIPNLRQLLKSGAMQHTLILVDEASIMYNNKKAELTEAEIQYFKLIRHYSSSLVCVSQSHDDISITLRRLYTEIYLLRYMPFFTLIQPIKKTVGIDEQTNQIIDKYRFLWIFSFRVFLRPLYFKFFNSWWIPDNVPIYDMEQFKPEPRHKKRKLKDRLFRLYKREELEKMINDTIDE